MREPDASGVIFFIVIIIGLTLYMSAYSNGKKDILSEPKQKDIDALEEFLLENDTGQKVFYEILGINLECEDQKTMELINFYEELRNDYEN